ncbi:membrane fusion protein, multidrug efflux system [Succinivibrio dextrinosolvens]|uniref:efflux RND transporter periplasmic adaptor subunit n=1 Tax=Succinivibrio dextrinosolvens TaxID=83771 RepID=UPI0008E12841|nr:efflux RND transporter periplasmic adaptor subunit [Succinivibrio dextrinosolvens]SFS74504.1 membrane fusion protein, multidrug efflux system [Succinivibrio dextrinosolvens]
MLLFRANKFILPCAIAAAIVSLAGCGKSENQQHGALPVDVTLVKKADVAVISRLTGRASATRKAEVRPQVTGILQKRLFVEGSIVNQGDQLYQIDPSVYEANVKSAEAALASAKATLHSSKLKADRYRSLLEKKAVSKQDYDDAQAAYLTANASVKSAEAALATANINLAYTKVYAPITGTISRSDITEGALVSSGQVTPLTTIQQLDPIYVDLGQTAEENILLRKNLTDGKLLNDGKAKVDIFLSDGTKYAHSGTIEFAEMSVDESTGMVNLRALVPNPEHILLPGIFLRGEINQGVMPQALTVAANGVQREANGITYVYAVNDQNVVQRINVKLGAQSENAYVVIDGLKEGDKVITSNTQKIRPGVPVTPIIPGQAPQDGQQAQQPQPQQK